MTLALGECPVWDAHRALLWCLDCRSGQLYAMDAQGQVQQQHAVPAPAGSFALNHDGQLVVALKEEIALYDPLHRTLRSLAHIGQSHPHMRLNDGAALPDGSFLCGSMHIFRAPGQAPLGGLYRLDTQGQLQHLADGLAVVNGPCVSPVNHRLHVCDSAARQIYSYALSADGQLSDRQMFAHTAMQASAPDGCCFDTEGGLWTALVHAGALLRFDAQGQPTHRINLPLAHPSSLCFGGAGMDQLFVTSISHSDRLAAHGPCDGAVLQLTGVGFQGAVRPSCHIQAA